MIDSPWPRRPHRPCRPAAGGAAASRRPSGRQWPSGRPPSCAARLSLPSCPFSSPSLRPRGALEQPTSPRTRSQLLRSASPWGAWPAAQRAAKGNMGTMRKDQSLHTPFIHSILTAAGGWELTQPWLRRASLFGTESRDYLGIFRKTANQTNATTSPSICMCGVFGVDHPGGESLRHLMRTFLHSPAYIFSSAHYTTNTSLITEHLLKWRIRPSTETYPCQQLKLLNGRCSELAEPQDPPDNIGDCKILVACFFDVPAGSGFSRLTEGRIERRDVGACSKSCDGLTQRVTRCPRSQRYYHYDQLPVQRGDRKDHARVAFPYGF